MKALVESAFDHFSKSELYERQFINYFRAQGMSKEEIDKLWVKAHSMKIIRIGAKSIIRNGKPPAMLGDVMVFILRGREEE